MTKMQEIRKSIRLPVSIPAGVYLLEKPFEVIDAEITNISEGGAFVHCTAPIGLGQEVLLEIRFAETKLLSGKVVEMKESDLATNLPDQKPQKSVVRWARGSSASGFGVEFVNLEADKKKFVTKLVQYFEQLAKAGVEFEAP